MAKADFRFSSKGYLTALISGFCIAAACAAFQDSSDFLRLFDGSAARFIRTGELKFTANISSLPPGHYFASVGRPRGACDLSLDSQIIGTTKASENGLRSRLGLGADFSIVANNTHRLLEIECQRDSGFAVGFTHQPVVMSYIAGQITQWWRELNTVYLGPLASLFLLSMAFSGAKRASLRNYLWLSLPYMSFALVAFFYSLSLSHGPRLFVDAMSSSVAHWLLRILFSFGFFAIVATHTRWTWGLGLGHSLPLIGLVIALNSDPSKFDSIYDISYLCFPVLGLLSASQLFRENLQSRSAVVLRFVSVAWVFLQIGDVVVSAVNKGPYSAPSTVVLIVLATAYVRRFDDLREQKIQQSTSNVLRVISGVGAVDSKLKSIGPIIQGSTHFKRYSTYIDAFVIGMYDRPSERFIRLAEAGYEKETGQDREINFSDGRGLIMQRALQSQAAQFGHGQNRNWYSVVPIGQHAVLNLSDDQKRPQFLAAESYEFTSRSLPVLQMLNSSLTELGARMSFALEVLRLLRGDGTWNEEIGCIFLDVNSFDDSLERFGEAYGRFIATVYLPALCQRVRRWAVREGNSAGDSVYLICISDLMQERCLPSEAVYKTIEEIIRFAEVEGAEMCLAQGYSPVRLQIGASAGLATVICDSFQARTSGKVVNQAARLQKAGQPGQVFVHTDLVKQWPTEGSLRSDVAQDELKKTRRLTGHRVYLRKTAS